MLFRCSPQCQPNDKFYWTCNQLGEGQEIHNANEKLNDSEMTKVQILPNKEAAEVAAAARFISQVDVISFARAAETSAQPPTKPLLGGSTTVRDSILDSPLNLPKTRSARTQTTASSDRNIPTRPPPPPPPSWHPAPATESHNEIQNGLPQRTSSKGAPSFDLVRPLDSVDCLGRGTASSSPELEAKAPLTTLTPESVNTFRFDFSTPTEPQLSRSASAATVDSQTPLTPLISPTANRIRQDVEAFVLDQRPHLRNRRRRTKRSHKPDNGSGEHDDEQALYPALRQELSERPPIIASETSTTEMLDSSDVIDQSSHQRKKSLFGFLQKRSEVEVDDLLDLYLTDGQQRSTKTLRHKTSRNRLAMFRSRTATGVLPTKATSSGVE